MKIPVLMYHGLHSASTPCRTRRESERYWVIDTDVFERQMAVLKEEGFSPVLLEELRETPGRVSALARPVVITFDDGHETNFLSALPILEGFGFRAEFFITTDWIGTPGFMAEERLRELRRRGMSVQSHARTHRFLTTLGEATAREELRSSRERLEAVLEEPVRFLSYPGGRYNARLERIAEEEGYRGTCISDHGYNTGTAGLFGMKRFGVSVNTTLPHFRALVTDDGPYFLRHRLKRLAASGLRRVLGRGAWERIHRMRAGNG